MKALMVKTFPSNDFPPHFPPRLLVLYFWSAWIAFEITFIHQ